ncbi:hypothetical protein QAD02_013734 [Eretmocerus hayati]|uniref:Uncharacterized protein n=1 Tax=Eretmocerus hayati TaxID=131215 RepID=A0ACC2P3I1_9HYME|nr:hypothetical protein QAD02_013734 [Eretmocerus hayati]
MPPARKVSCSQRQSRRRIGAALSSLNFVDVKRSNNITRFRPQQISRSTAVNSENSRLRSQDHKINVPPYMLNRFLHNIPPVEVSPQDASGILLRDEKLSCCSSKGAEVDIFPGRDHIIIHGFDQSCFPVDNRENLNVIGDDSSIATVDRLSHESKSTSVPEDKYVGDQIHESETPCDASDSSISFNEPNPCLASQASSNYASSQNHSALRTYTF